MLNVKIRTLINGEQVTMNTYTYGKRFISIWLSVQWGDNLIAKHNTVDGESFAGLNFRGLLATSVYVIFIIKLVYNIHGKTFAVLFKTAKTAKVWPSESFPVYGRSYKD